jgi:AraC-like DNA-binding protein
VAASSAATGKPIKHACVRYQEIRPNAVARRFVRTYWLLEDAAPDAHIQRVVPDGRTELIFNLGQPYEALTGGVWKPQAKCFLFGQITGPLLLRSAGPTQIIGICFHPHTAGQLLRIPLHEATDSAISVDEISARLSRRLDQLEKSRTPQEQGAALDSIVLALTKRAGDDNAMVRIAVQELSGGMNVETVAYHAGLSRRQLERRFREAVGIPPKLFARMQRFQRVFSALESADPGWAEAAVRCGYYDQAHLIRDFREFAGKPPVALVAEDSDLARHFLQGSGTSHFSKTMPDGLR